MDEADFTSSTYDVAIKAYFAHENQGLQAGHEVQHWLQADAAVIAERKLMRINGFYQTATNFSQPTL